MTDPALTLDDPRLAQAVAELVDRRIRATVETLGGTRYGIVASIAAGAAAVRLGGSATASPGFWYPAYLDVQVGDQVRVVVAGADRYIEAVVPGHAYVPPAPPVVHDHLGHVTRAYEGCYVYRSTTQAIPNAAWTRIQHNVDQHDPFGFHDPVGLPGRFVVPWSGVYLCVARVGLAGGAAWILEWSFDGALGNEDTWTGRITDPGGFAYGIENVRVANLAAGHYAEVWLYNGHTAARNVLALTTASVIYLGSYP